MRSDEERFVAHCSSYHLPPPVVSDDEDGFPFPYVLDRPLQTLRHFLERVAPLAAGGTGVPVVIAAEARKVRGDAAVSVFEMSNLPRSKGFGGIVTRGGKVEEDEPLTVLHEYMRSTASSTRECRRPLDRVRTSASQPAYSLQRDRSSLPYSTKQR